MIEDSGRVGCAETGPHASHEAPAGLRPPGFDPARVVKATRIEAAISVEHEDASGMPTGDRYIWARHETHPQLDTLLVTVHYSYVYLDNSSIGAVADKIARMIAGRNEDAAADMEARIKAVRNVIAYGYSRRRADGKPINPLRNGEQCEHGRYEWEDCIGCYDEALLNVLDGVTGTRDSGRLPKGEDPKGLSAEQARAGRRHRPAPTPKGPQQ